MTSDLCGQPAFEGRAAKVSTSSMPIRFSIRHGLDRRYPLAADGQPRHDSNCPLRMTASANARRPAPAAAARVPEGFGHRRGTRFPRRPAAGPPGRRGKPRRDQHCEQAFEVALAGGLDEGVDDFLLAEIGVRRGRRTLRRLAWLANCLAASGVRPTIGAISSKGTANMSCSTKASRSAPAFPARSNAAPTGQPYQYRAHVDRRRQAPARAPIGSSRRDLRERSMSRTRATTVVSQPPRFRPNWCRAAQPQPSLLRHRRPAGQTQHAVNYRARMGPVGLEFLRKFILIQIFPASVTFPCRVPSWL